MSDAVASHQQQHPSNFMVTYVPDTGKFMVTEDDGTQFEVSPMMAVLYVLQHRYVVLSEVTAEKTRELQEQITQINEANVWLNAVTTAAGDSDFIAPTSTGEEGEEDHLSLLTTWMEDNGLDTSSFDDPPSLEDFKNAQIQISNYVDQLSSNNDLRLLSLKSTVAKAEQALSAADGVLQNIKRLMQMLANNMAQ